MDLIPGEVAGPPDHLLARDVPVPVRGPQSWRRYFDSNKEHYHIIYLRDVLTYLCQDCGTLVSSPCSRRRGWRRSLRCSCRSPASAPGSAQPVEASYPWLWPGNKQVDIYSKYYLVQISTPWHSCWGLLRSCGGSVRTPPCRGLPTDPRRTSRTDVAAPPHWSAGPTPG